MIEFFKYFALVIFVMMVVLTFLSSLIQNEYRGLRKVAFAVLVALTWWFWALYYWFKDIEIEYAADPDPGD